MFEQYNMQFKRTVKEGIETDNMEYRALKDFIGKTIVVDGYFFNDKGKFGRQLVLVGNGYLINMPTRCVETFEEIDKDDSKIEAILKGHLALVNIEMKVTTNGTTTIFDYKDI